VFFSEDIASDRGAGAEILQGTALRMPKVPDYESFRRIIDKVICLPFPSLLTIPLPVPSSTLQLPDTDAPFVFSLPDNIERSLQRVTSSGVIRQLRALSTLDAEANKFDREKWRAQVSLLISYDDTE
jgi:hypothetical protein